MGNNFGGIAFLNELIRNDEVGKNVFKLKRNKALGIDGIPTDVLQERSFLVPVWLFITTWFEYGRIPSIWQYGIISPIPKSRDKNKYVPLNYRGIRLLRLLCLKDKLYYAIKSFSPGVLV